MPEGADEQDLLRCLVAVRRWPKAVEIDAILDHGDALGHEAFGQKTISVLLRHGDHAVEAASVAQLEFPPARLLQASCDLRPPLRAAPQLPVEVKGDVVLDKHGLDGRGAAKLSQLGVLDFDDRYFFLLR